MSPYSLTPEQQKLLDNCEHEMEAFLFEPMDPKDPNSSHEKELYNLIWSKIRLRLNGEQINHKQSQAPWSLFHLLEKEWTIEAPHPPAFQCLVQLLTTAKFEPQGFLQSQNQYVIAKLLVGSVAWWFAPCFSGQSTKSVDFSQPSTTLIQSLVKYDAYFSESGSIVSVLQRLYSRFEVSRFKVFDLKFMQGQCNHSLRRESERRKQIEVETQERAMRAIEANKLEIAKLKMERQEEIARHKRQNLLHEEGKRAIAHWRVGDVEKCIATAKNEKFEEIFETWLQDAKEQERKFAGIKSEETMKYRVDTIKSILHLEALSVEVNS